MTIFINKVIGSSKRVLKWAEKKFVEPLLFEYKDINFSSIVTNIKMWGKDYIGFYNVIVIYFVFYLILIRPTKK